MRRHNLGLVGIIANPAASKDIRRLVAQGRVVPDWEKVNIVRRVMLGLQAVGANQILAMADSSNLVRRAADDPTLAIELEFVDQPPFYSEGDTVRAAAVMAESGVDCLITLGGDGTNRAAVAGTRNLPMVAISTGTNNVFPTMVEGTLAGLAAGLVAGGRLDLAEVSVSSKILNVYVDGELRDIALIDVALSKERFVASKAIWDMDTLFEVFLTRAEPASIGLSSIGARLEAVSLADEGGLRYSIADSEEPEDGPSRTVLAPIAPGVVPPVVISSWQRMADGERYSIVKRDCTVALDGERAFSVNRTQQLEIEVRRDGPPIIDVELALKVAAAQGLFDLAQGN
ncbi:MAG: ATP-NAD kinase [Chloroflexi bacterium]|nr:MAG: ATP-NAD kinase [Dehalococcoidia bacterium]RUA19819.1 MAG: ATP-NAD kinase [Chloroflexota bacterium]RUA30065.1 MAG: ATP-NAD kinase [Chloroflexota bacterium]HIN23286.1 ATP-NAD kinase [Dehalococcoidia bacterium]